MSRYPKPGMAYVYGMPPKREWTIPRWVGLSVVVALAGLIFSYPTRSQLQQSGGTSSVTVTGSLPGGSNIIGKVGIDQTTPGTTNLVSIGTNGTVALGAGSAVIGHVIADTGSTTAVTALPSIPSGSSLIGYTRAQNGCGTTNYEAGLQNLPNSSTQLTATTTCVLLVSFTNTTAGAVTVTMQDQTTACNSAPCQVLTAFSIPANSNLLLPLYGMKFTSGIKWNASAANSITADLIGNQ